MFCKSAPAIALAFLLSLGLAACNDEAAETDAAGGNATSTGQPMPEAEPEGVGGTSNQ